MSERSVSQVLKDGFAAASSAREERFEDGRLLSGDVLSGFGECDFPGDGRCGGIMYPVVTPRPSDPSELVSIGDQCRAHANLMEDAASIARAFEEGSTHLCALPEVWDEYMESAAARKNGHLFLTV